MALYEILDKNGVTLCYQTAKSEDDALHLAKNYYGFKRAHSAQFIRDVT